MTVCIAEKPSVARDIAAVLGARNQCQGYLEGNGYQVTWVFGHLCELKEPHEYSPMWKSWSLSSLPMIPPRFGIKLKKDQGVERQFAVIKGLVANADRIINCGDAGQEGELIQRWVMQLAEVKCPVERLWISSLTEESIREGFQTLKDQSEYRSLYEAGLCRAIGDWLLGMNATRLYTLRYGSNRQVLSIGRVQTPTLALIVNRQREIENFTPEPYWVLSTVYRDTTFTAVLEEGQRGFKTKEQGAKAMADIAPLPFTVTDVQKKKGTEAPARLFDLTSLQVECNNKFGFSADQTLQIIQSLYERKFTTYPRVDTTFLSDDIYPKCGPILRGIEQLYPTQIGALHGRKLLKSKKVFDSSKVTDHHAIIPTGVPPQGLSMPEQDVFNLIALRFIAAFYPDCRFDQTIVLGECGEWQFKATGKVITDKGWKEVYANEKAPTEEAPQSPDAAPTAAVLPVFKKGESGPHTPTLTEKTTTPPKPYTEATLLRAMETAGRLVEDETLRDALKENGIGRPSTRAAIIETLFKRGYIEKKGGKGKSLYATPTGVSLIGLIQNDLLKSAELTGQWERKLRQIEHHEYDAATFIAELKTMVTDVVREVFARPYGS
ncbi:MAG: DNA topoisomerase 3 [Bacteroidaceae bacterium]|nr:DNA topoisomerase 3 [Bacteroidaceae bacterium]